MPQAIAEAAEKSVEEVKQHIQQKFALAIDDDGYAEATPPDAIITCDGTREGAHAHHRILFHEDITGKEITSHLLNAVKKLKNVRMYEYTTLLDILCDGSKCCGGIISAGWQGRTG